jgi:hypothetical protein
MKNLKLLFVVLGVAFGALGPICPIAQPTLVRQKRAALRVPYWTELVQLHHGHQKPHGGRWHLWSDQRSLPGYNINIISNLRLSEHFDLRFTPGFAATVRNLHFDMNDPFTNERKTISRQIESSYVQFPLHLKFKSVRIDNYRLYLMGGIRYANDLASKAKVVDDNLFKLQRHTADYEIGFGTDFYFEYFKFSPQIRASWGLTNLLVQDGTPQVSALDGIRNRAVLINFTFE